MKTKTEVVEFSKAQGLIQSQTLKIAKNPEGHSELSSVLEKNVSVIEAVLAKGLDAAILPSTLVTIEVEDEPQEGEVLKGLSERLDALTALVEKLSKSDTQQEEGKEEGKEEGGEEASSDGEDVSKAEGVAFSLASELLSGYITKLNAFKAKFDATGGAVESQEVYDAFSGQWEVKDSIAMATVAMGKADKETIDKASELLVAEIAKYQKSEDEAKEDGEEAGKEEPAGEGEASSDDDTQGQDVSKSDGEEEDYFGADLSPPLEN